MLIYSYSPIAKEYIGTSEALIDHIESKKQNKEIYFLPASATFEAPPACTENQIQVFEDNSWVIKQNYRGQTYYDKTTGDQIAIDFIGEIPDNLQSDKPTILIQKETRQSKIQTDIQELISFYTDETNFPLGLQVAFSPAKDAVMKYMLANDYESALKVIRTIPLSTDLEPVRQQFINKLQGLI